VDHKITFEITRDVVYVKVDDTEFYRKEVRWVAAIELDNQRYWRPDQGVQPCVGSGQTAREAINKALNELVIFGERV
jgi:hypothetical protein